MSPDLASVPAVLKPMGELNAPKSKNIFVVRLLMKKCLLEMKHTSENMLTTNFLSDTPSIVPFSRVLIGYACFDCHP